MKAVSRTTTTTTPKGKEIRGTILVYNNSATLILPSSFVELVGIDRDATIKAIASRGALVIKKADR